MKDTSVEEILKTIADAPKTLRHIHTQITKTVLESVEESISRHHFEVLKLLDEDGKLSITEIGGMLVISKPQMTRLIDELTSVGAVNRETDPNDRRKSLISLTDKGNRIVTRAMDTLDQTLRARLMPLSEQDLEDLSRSLQTVTQITQKMI